MKVHAIIPARGGSKRVPNKNIRLVDNIPLIAHVIRILGEVPAISSIIVSTDSLSVAKIASESGASVPFMREKGLSDDYTPTHPVIKDAILKTSWISDDDIVLCVYPFAILLRPEFVKQALSVYVDDLLQDQYLVSIVSYQHPIERSFNLGPDSTLFPRFPSKLTRRTQDLDPSYHDAGQFYIGSTSVWLSHSAILTCARGFVLPRNHIVDVDTEADFEDLLLRWSIQKSTG
jgi:CMP-N-acetylneuraminic acid synthetase